VAKPVLPADGDAGAECSAAEDLAKHCSRFDSTHAHAVIAGGEPNLIAAAVFRDGQEDHGVVYTFFLSSVLPLQAHQRFWKN
jgi:hypothetical protein